VAVALALTASACGGGSEAATPKRTTTTAAATTTTVAAPVAPLTGLADPSGASLTRPALSVKVENTDAAVERIVELGGSVMRPPADMPYGRHADVADPQGAMFSVIKSANPEG